MKGHQPQDDRQRMYNMHGSERIHQKRFLFCRRSGILSENQQLRQRGWMDVTSGFCSCTNWRKVALAQKFNWFALAQGLYQCNLWKFARKLCLCQLAQECMPVHACAVATCASLHQCRTAQMCTIDRYYDLLYNGLFSRSLKLSVVRKQEHNCCRCRLPVCQGTELLQPRQK